jgi:ketosteroid isomerase-like protein
MTHDHRRAPRSEHEQSVELADEPGDHVAAYVAAFNTGSIDKLEMLYEDHSVVVPRPGHPATGADRRTVNQHLLSFGLPISATTRHLYVVDDLALLVVAWSIRGTTRDGREVNLMGTASDVVRRGADGKWRYVIDNPFGTAEAVARTGQEARQP